MGNSPYFNKALAPKMYTIQEPPSSQRQHFYYHHSLAESVENIIHDQVEAKQKIEQLNQSSEQVVEDIQKLLNKLNQNQLLLQEDYGGIQERLQALTERQEKLEREQEAEKSKTLSFFQKIRGKINDLTDRQTDEEQQITEQMLIIAQLQEEVNKLRDKLNREAIYLG